MNPKFQVIEHFNMSITRKDASLMAHAIRRFLDTNAEPPRELTRPDRTALGLMTRQRSTLADGGTPSEASRAPSDLTTAIIKAQTQATEK